QCGSSVRSTKEGQRVRNVRKALRSGEVVVGSWINTASPIVAELLAGLGFDFLCVDAEHSAVNEPQAQMLFQAMRAGNPDCAALVRLPGHDYQTIKRYMDAGADGVVAPLINTAEQAREVVSAVKYPPEGMRGVGFCRDNLYGANFDQAVGSANDRTLAAVQIEHIEGVENIHEILDVPGVDAVFIGPYDLSASMGIVKQFDHPDMIAATGRILKACKEKNIIPGIHVVPPHPNAVNQRIDEGYRFIAYSLDITMLAEVAGSGLKKIRSHLAEKP
ncbi:MAG: HpcH/HpaI aldolase family protein, partial [Phycisphaerae bacterium]